METRAKVVIAVVVCLILCSVQKYAVGTEPIAHWRLDEADGNTVYDSAGTMNGTVYGAEWALGIIGGALDFDGFNDYVEVPDSNVLDITSQISLSAWVRPGTMPGFQFIVAKWGPGNTASYGMRIEDSHPRFFLMQGFSKTAKTYTDLSTAPNVWAHMVVTWDGQTMKAYLDGTVSDQNELFTGTINSADEPLAIGYNSGMGGGTGGGYFHGLIDEVMVFDQALSAEEVRLLYERGHARTVAVDIKPGSCPNPLNLGSRGVLPVAILGSAEFDVNDIDPASIRLVGVGPVRSGFDDVATPVADANECDCTDADGDGYTDLTLKFETTEIAEQLIEMIPDLAKGDKVALTLTATMTDQTQIVGEDCVIIVGKVPQSLKAKKSDINEDGMVNMNDFGIMAGNWLVHTAAK